MNNIDNRGAVDWPQYVLGRFSDVRQEHNRDKWVACCPAHDDTHPSLAIGFGDNGSLILTCRAGCTIGAVLDRSGLEYSDLYPPDQRGQKRTTKPVGEPKPSASVAPHNKELREREQADALRAANNRWATLYTNPKRAEGLTILAGKLGVRADVLHGMGVVFDQERNAWMIPERGFKTQHDNSDGTPKDNDANRQGFVGFHWRYHDGKKKHQTGTRRGLTYAKLKPDATAPRVIICPEGASDVAALLSMGIYAIGRPGAKSGKEHLRAFCNQHREWFTDDGAELVILGENDKGAGREGAKATAEYLKAKLPLLRVRWALPPADVKDARQWLNAQQADLNDANTMRALGESFLTHLNYSEFAKNDDWAKDVANNPRKDDDPQEVLTHFELNKKEILVQSVSKPNDARPIEQRGLRPPYGCRHKFNAALQRKDNRWAGKVIAIICTRPSCPACCYNRKIKLARHCLDVIQTAQVQGQQLYYLVACPEDEKRLSTSVRNAARPERNEGTQGLFFSIRPNPNEGRTHFTTMPVKRAKQLLTASISHADAINMVRELCEGIDWETHKKLKSHKRIFAACEEWRPEDDWKTGKYILLGTAKTRPDELHQVVKSCEAAKAKYEFLGSFETELFDACESSVEDGLYVELSSEMFGPDEVTSAMTSVFKGEYPAGYIAITPENFAELFPQFATSKNNDLGDSASAPAPIQGDLFADDADGPNSL